MFKLPLVTLTLYADHFPHSKSRSDSQPYRGGDAEASYSTVERRVILWSLGLEGPTCILIIFLLNGGLRDKINYYVLRLALFSCFVL